MEKKAQEQLEKVKERKLKKDTTKKGGAKEGENGSKTKDHQVKAEDTKNNSNDAKQKAK